MTEENTDGAPAANTVPASDDTSTAANDTVPAGNDTVPADNPKEPEASADWRDAFAGGDEKFRKQLDRYSTQSDFAKAHQEAVNRIREGFKAPELPENATPEQVAEYRKQVGVPEAPDQYKHNLPEGIVMGEADKPLWELFQAEAHAHNLSQAEFDKVLPAYYKMEMALREQQEKDFKEAAAKNEAALKDDWGSDYKSNLTINENFIVKEGGDALKDVLLNSITPDGAPLGNHPMVAKFINQMARMQGFTDGVVYNSEGTAQNINEELHALLDKRTGANWNTYSQAVSKEQQARDTARINDLLAMQKKLKTK